MSKALAGTEAARQQKGSSVYCVPSKKRENKDYAIPLRPTNKDYAVPATSPEMSEALTMGGKTTTFAETDVNIEPIDLISTRQSKTAQVLIRMLTKDDGGIKYYNRVIAVILFFLMITVVTFAFTFMDNEYLASYITLDEKSEETYCYGAISLLLNRA